MSHLPHFLRWLCAIVGAPKRPQGRFVGNRFTCDSAPRSLTPQQRMAEYLKKRGLTLAEGEKSGLRLVDAATAQSMNFYPALPGIVIPYFHPLTQERHLNVMRLRYLGPPNDTKGKPQKFTQPKGSPVEAYFDPSVNWKRALTEIKTPLHVVEGEIKAIAANKHDFVTVGIGGVDNFGGEELTPWLNEVVWANRNVYIVFDSDIGQKEDVKRAEQRLARALSAKGACVKLVRLPNVIPGGKTGLDDLLEIAGASAFEATRDAALPYNTAPGGEPIIECLANIQTRVVEWLWDGRIAFGHLNAIVGDPGLGKSTVAIDIAAKGSRGFEPYPKENCAPFTTLYLSNENVHAITTKPRFAAMGGDESALQILDGARNPDGTIRPITFADTDVIESAIKKTNARLVIFDPYQSYMPPGVDSHKAPETRPVFDGLAKLAERTNVAILIIAHLTKQSGSRAINGILGSIDIAGAFRSILMIGTASDDSQNRAMIHIKISIGKFTEPLKFGIEGEGAASRVVWLGRSELTVADLRAPEQGRKNPTQKDRARSFGRAALADGPRVATELFAEWAEESGWSLDRAERTLREGMKGLLERNYEGGKHGSRMWKLAGPKKYERKQGEKGND